MEYLSYKKEWQAKKFENMGVDLNKNWLCSTIIIISNKVKDHNRSLL